MRASLTLALVLHRRPYRETSLLLEVLSQEHGRLGLVARGAARPRSRLRPLLQPFQPLLLGWTGRGDLATLTAAEEAERLPALPAARLLSGLYLNELLIVLLARMDPHPELYQSYRAALIELAISDDEQIPLRRFEVRLLAALGYGLQLTHEADTGRPLVPERWYCYLPERGPLANTASTEGIRISGRSLLALASGQLGEPGILREVKQLTRAMLAIRLDKPLLSRAVVTALRRPASPGDRTRS